MRAGDKDTETTIGDRRVLIPRSGDVSLYALCRAWVRNNPALPVAVEPPESPRSVQPAERKGRADGAPEGAQEEGAQEVQLDILPPPQPATQLETETRPPTWQLEEHPPSSNEEALRKLKEHWVGVRQYHQGLRKAKLTRYRERLQTLLGEPSALLASGPQLQLQQQQAAMAQLQAMMAAGAAGSMGLGGAALGGMLGDGMGHLGAQGGLPGVTDMGLGALGAGAGAGAAGGIGGMLLGPGGVPLPGLVAGGDAGDPAAQAALTALLAQMATGQQPDVLGGAGAGAGGLLASQQQQLLLGQGQAGLAGLAGMVPALGAAGPGQPPPGGLGVEAIQANSQQMAEQIAALQQQLAQLQQANAQAGFQLPAPGVVVGGEQVAVPAVAGGLGLTGDGAQQLLAAGSAALGLGGPPSVAGTAGLADGLTKMEVDSGAGADGA